MPPMPAARGVARLLSDAAQAEVAEVEAQLGEGALSRGGDSHSNKASGSRPASASASSRRTRTRTLGLPGFEHENEPELAGTQDAPLGPSEKHRELIESEFKLSAFHRGKLYAAHVPKPSQKQRDAHYVRATRPARPKSARPRAAPVTPTESEFGVYLKMENQRGATSPIKSEPSVHLDTSEDDQDELDSLQGGGELEADLDLWLSPAERLGKAEADASRAGSQLAEAVQVLHALVDAGAPCEAERKAIVRGTEAELKLRMRCLALARLQAHVSTFQTRARDHTKLAQSHLYLSAAYLDRCMFSRAAEHASWAREASEEAYESESYDMDDNLEHSLRRCHTMALLQQAECVVLQKDAKPNAALRLLEEAMRSDSVLCMEGDPSRVPLLFLRADAYRALSRLSIQAACKLLGQSDASYLEMSALAQQPLPANMEAYCGGGDAAHQDGGGDAAFPEWLLQEWEHEGVSYLLDVGAGRVYEAPAGAGRVPQPVGRFSEDGEVEWIAEQGHLFPTLKQVVRSTPAAVEESFNTLTRDNLTGVLETRRLPMLLEMLLPEVKDTEISLFQSLMQFPPTRASITVHELRDDLEACCAADAAARSGAVERGSKADVRAKVASYLETNGARFAAVFAKAAAKGGPKSDQLFIRKIGALLQRLASLTIRDTRVLLVRLHMWDVERAGALSLLELQRAVGAVSIRRVPYELAEDAAAEESPDNASALQRARYALALRNPQAELEWRRTVLETAAHMAKSTDDLIEIWDILDSMEDGQLHPQQARVYMRLKDLYRQQGKWEDEALQCSRLAHHLREGVEVPIERTERPAFMQRPPERPEARLAAIEGDLALLQTRLGDIGAALAHCDAAWELYLGMHGERDVAKSAAALKVLKLRALLLAKSEHLAEAAEEYRLLIRHQKTRKGPGSAANLADTYMQLAAALTALSDDPLDAKAMQLDEVCRCYEKAAVLYAKKNTPANLMKGEDARQRLVEVQKMCIVRRPRC